MLGYDGVYGATKHTPQFSDEHGHCHFKSINRALFNIYNNRFIKDSKYI